MPPSGGSREQSYSRSPSLCHCSENLAERPSACWCPLFRSHRLDFIIRPARCLTVDRGGLRGEENALLDPLLAPCSAPSEEHPGADSSLKPVAHIFPNPSQKSPSIPNEA
ncbi:hypothetical protein D4764_11G0005060 [Takifugu flavidus]|uniref:Uncharacterized protein n=1 Tax=Takifugu flavidus TaxID=433684 RepID=A0A5C6PG71_9TELE|nr:hypothetical protein D4764_11G0005060 [Takifugu flavidus]